MTETSFGAALSRLWSRAPKALLEGIIASAPAVIAKYELTPLVLAHVLAQISHECGAGREIVENLNYSPEGIVRTWPTRFRSVADALPFAYKPQALANKVYNGRMGNRAGSNDGWLFRGRGGTNTTGHDGYYKLAMKMALDLLNDPDKVNDPKLFFECAVVDFILCGCVAPAKRDDERLVTRRLNGGLIGFAQRQEWLRKWKAALVEVYGPEALTVYSDGRPAGVLAFGDSGLEVKGLQNSLAAKGYSCGHDDGDYLEGTRNAVLALQADEGLPTNGTACQETKDALEQSVGRPVGEGRALATVTDLRAAGSRTVAAADRLGQIGKAKAALGTAGLTGWLLDKGGALDLDGVQGGIDKAQQAYGMFASVKSLLKPLLSAELMLPIAVAIAVAGLLVLIESRRIAAARVDDHRSGANMGR
jgi:putative chitinase